MSNPRLAAVAAEYDAASTTLALKRGGRAVAHGDLSTQTGRTVIEQLFAAYMGGELRGAPRLVDGGDAGFTDADAPFGSIIHPASLGHPGQIGRELVYNPTPKSPPLR